MWFKQIQIEKYLFLEKLELFKKIEISDIFVQNARCIAAGGFLSKSWILPTLEAHSFFLGHRMGLGTSEMESPQFLDEL